MASYNIYTATPGLHLKINEYKIFWNALVYINPQNHLGTPPQKKKKKKRRRAEVGRTKPSLGKSLQGVVVGVQFFSWAPMSSVLTNTIDLYRYCENEYYIYKKSKKYTIKSEN
jgi:hypothetical protein